MRYALHDKRDSTELRFQTLNDLWAHVRTHALCSEETDPKDVGHARRLLDPNFEIHDFDQDGVVRIEGRARPQNID
jgi:hypothetical protein